MAAPRPKKKAPVKKKPPAKKKPSFLRKDTSRPARDAGKGGMRQATMDSLKQGPSQPQGPEAPRYPEKIGPKKPDPKRPLLRLKGGTLYVRKDAASVIMKKAASKIPVVGAAVGFITDAAPAGAGSDKPSGPLMKSNMPGGYGSKTSGYGPTPKKKASAIMPKTSMAGGGVNKPGGKSSSDTLRKAGAGTYTASYDVKAKKSGSSKAASVAPAKASSGTSPATSKATKAATSVSKTKRRSPTRYQRNETAMEQKFRKG